MGKKKSVIDFLQMKKEGEKITFLTCYDYPTATFAEKAGWICFWLVIPWVWLFMDMEVLYP